MSYFFNYAAWKSTATILTSLFFLDMMFALWIIPYKSFKKSAKIQTKIKKFNMVNLFSITYRATTFLRDMITNNEQKDTMSTFCFWEKILFTFWWFYSTLEGTGFYYCVNKGADSNNSFLNFFSAHLPIFTISNQDLGNLLIAISIGKQTEEARISFFHQ